MKALGARGAGLPVEAVAELGRALIHELEAAPGAHLSGTTPDQVLLDRTGRVRVLGPPGHRRGRSSVFTFMSPELVRGEAPGEASDVYSVCALLFGAASGRPPVPPGASELDTLRAVLDGQVTSLDRLRPALPASFVQVIHRGLAPSARERFATLASLAEALRPFSSGGRGALVTTAFEVAPASVPPPPLRDAADARVLEAIARGDESARLVYADLLEERGLVDHAQWLRLEAEAQGAPEQQRPALIAALTVLRPRVGPAFIASVGRAPLEGCPIVFGFRCPMKWEQLRPTQDDRVRFCEGCASTVTYFDELDEARRASWSGACVAVDLTVERSEGDLSPSEFTMGRIA
jgi:uncharacterized protein (TIGR02996 family)